jgi:NADH-quinone oxidoreductase subunit C
VIPLPPLAPPGVLIEEALACDAAFFATPEQYADLAAALKVDGFEMCVDVCGVDYLEHFERYVPEGVTPTRFEVVANFLSLSRKLRVRVRVQAGNESPRVDSLFHVYPGTEAPERETFDMFGILFDGHPDLTRILMPEEWEGHPLRKDYAVGHVPIQFKESPGPR